jgi:large subunit ribosomal protein L18
MRPEQKHRLEQLRRWRIRKKVQGTRERPRMSVRFTGKNIYVQFVDDGAGVTLASASTRSKAIPDREKLAANVAGAQIVGRKAAEEAKSKGIEAVVFDRSGARYHGKVKALADAAREAGLKF